MKYDTVFFDLDGTIDDSAPGIVASVRHALAKMGEPDRAPEELLCFIGPPLIPQFMAFCGYTKEKAEEAVKFYREIYSEKEIYNVRIYPGIEDLLKALKKAGLRTAVTTSKPEHFARRILEHYGLDVYFDAIVGPHSDNVSEDKREVLAEACRIMDVKPQDGRTVLVGDRKYDVRGAKITGLDFIGVSYGYAPEGEFEAEGVACVADSPAELEKILIGG